MTIQSKCSNRPSGEPLFIRQSLHRERKESSSQTDSGFSVRKGIGERFIRLKSSFLEAPCPPKLPLPL